MANITKKQFASGAFWKIFEQFSTKGISMLVSVILSRLLLAEDYGLIALTVVFTNLSDVLIDGGFSTALIRKEHIDDYDYACAFSISSSISLVLYVLLFVFAPTVAAYYKEPELTAVLRVMGLTFFIQAFASTRTALVNRNMQFKFLFYCNAIANVVSGIIGIVLAYLGFRVWALVAQRLIQQILLTVLLFIKIKWKMKWRFDLGRLKEMLKFSMGVVSASLLNFVGSNFYSVVIGKQYSVADLGYYDKGGQLPMQFSLFTFGAMSSVLLPTIASCQSDLARVKSIIRRVTQMTSFLIMPMMVGMCMISKELIVLLFSERWLPSVTIMQCSCLYYLATPYMLINVQIFFGLGHSEKRMKTEAIRLAMMFASIIVFSIILKLDINWLAFISALIAVIAALVTYVEAKKMIDYRVKETIHDMWKPLAASVVMGGILIIVDQLLQSHNIGLFFSMVIKVAAGALVYALISKCLSSEGLNECVNMLREMKHKVGAAKG